LRREARPEVRVIASEEFTEEDSGHSTGVEVRRELKEVSEF
jgi:hypothetical protein